MSNISCKDCELAQGQCICAFITKFFNENGHLMSRLAEIEASEKEGARRCVSCQFYNCICGRLFSNKKKGKV